MSEEKNYQNDDKYDMVEYEWQHSTNKNDTTTYTNFTK